MTDEAALLATVVADPDSDTPRLVYADFIEENGQEERAEFIRLQIRIALYEAEPHLGGKLCPADPERMKGECPCTWHSLRRRERELLGPNWEKWTPFRLPSDPNNFATMFCRNLWPHERCPDPHIEFRRGFVAQIACSFPFWLTHAAAIRAATPLREVTLTTRPTGGEWATMLTLRIPSVTHKDYPGITFHLPAERSRTHQNVSAGMVH